MNKSKIHEIAIAKYHSEFVLAKTLGEAIEDGKNFFRDNLLCSKEHKIEKLCQDLDTKTYITTKEASKAGFRDCPDARYWLTNSVEAMMLCVLYNVKLN